ncbi:MAG: hypothetical protein H8F28_03815 [Fibrella sp.]|nr:hypothetical protein [Armatimonadota bacterium]
MNRTSRIAAIMGILFVPSLVALSGGSASSQTPTPTPSPTKVTVTFEYPVARPAPDPKPPVTGRVETKFKTSNAIERYDFTPNQSIAFLGEFRIFCDGEDITYDGPSHVNTVKKADLTGVYKNSFVCSGSKQHNNNTLYSATANATFTLNNTTNTGSAPSVSFYTGNTATGGELPGPPPPPNPD